MATSDVVILLIGLHGSGKSTFTRAATKAQVKVSGSHYPTGPTTKTCQRCTTQYRRARLTIIDTPGLADNNTHEQNLQILGQIADQLVEMGQASVSGVVYFHSIENLRLGRVHMANFKLLQAICGEKFPHVAFVTSRWDRVNLTDDNSRKEYETLNHDLELERRNLLPKGPRIIRFLDDGKSYKRILDYFADQVETQGPEHPPQLQFAEELKRYQYKKRPERAIRKTRAGRQVEDERKKVSRGMCVLL